MITAKAHSTMIHRRRFLVAGTAALGCRRPPHLAKDKRP